VHRRGRGIRRERKTMGGRKDRKEEEREKRKIDRVIQGTLKNSNWKLWHGNKRER
jgi:hypothetical protein